MDDEQLRQDFRESVELYEGRTAKDRWLTACAAFLGLRHRVLAKWASELHQERSPDQDYALCYSLRNLAVGNQTHLLERERAEDWDAVMEMCDHLSEWYASEMREFRILTHRVYSTFAPLQPLDPAATGATLSMLLVLRCWRGPALTRRLKGTRGQSLLAHRRFW